MVSTVVRAYACVGANCAATSRTVIGWRSTINWSSSHSAGLKYRGFRIGPPHWRKMSSLPFDGICRQKFQEIRCRYLRAAPIDGHRLVQECPSLRARVIRRRVERLLLLREG